MSHTENLHINKLIQNINSLINNKNKNEFIENYSTIKDQINKTDTILSGSNNIELNNLSINELFGILEKNKNNITNFGDIDIISLKYYSDIIEILENKLNNEKVEIIEIK